MQLDINIKGVKYTCAKVSLDFVMIWIERCCLENPDKVRPCSLAPANEADMLIADWPQGCVQVDTPVLHNNDDLSCPIRHRHWENY